MNTGRQIKDTFIQFRNNIDSINTFDSNTNDILLSIIKNSDGNHMSNATTNKKF